jgi:AraC family transcriptional regulator of adaptative response / DNA-3-methyladenine glycosylase II
MDIAMAAGFGSLRRFNALFKKHYRLSPTALRKRTSSAKENAGTITLTLGYRPPYQWQQIINFLAQRAIPGVEIAGSESWMRTVQYINGEQKHVYGWIRVEHRPEKNALAVTVGLPLLPALPHLLARVRHLFDLYCYPDAVYETLSVMNNIKLDLCISGTRLPGCFEPFEMIVRAVLGQQITVKAANTLAGRLVETYGTPLETDVAGLNHTFPSAQDIAALPGDIANHLGPLGITRTRADTIFILAQKIVNGELDLTFCVQPEAEIKKLMSISGIGAWTAQYIAMRAMGWPDAFPHTDHGVKKALAPRSEDEILQTAEAWRPWRSYATINLWNSLKA